MNRRRFVWTFTAPIACLGLAQHSPKRDIKITPRSGNAQRSASPAGTPAERDIRPPLRVRGRKALCIGINAYTAVGTLRNAVHDATDMHAALTKHQFQSTLLTNTPIEQMNRELKRFAESLSPTDVAFFFFAGHGVQIGGTNFIIPVDFRPADEIETAKHSLSGEQILTTITRARPRLAVLLLDACRNNPFRPANSGAGLAPVPPTLGTMTVFATGAGRTASDNSSGRNGLFTGHFLAALPHHLPLQGLTRKVRDDVFTASKGQQRPYIQEDVIGDFYFQNTAALPPDPKPQQPNPVAPGPKPAVQDATEGRQSPDFMAPALESGMQAYRARDYVKALEAFEAAARENPESAAAWDAIGATCAQMGQLARAVDMYAKAIRISPGYVAAYVNRGLAFLTLPKYQLAADDFSWAIEENPDDPQLLLWRARAWLGLRQFDKALSDLDASVSFDSGSAEAYRFRGQVKHRMANYDQALQDYGLAIQVRPTYWQAYEDRAVTLGVLARQSEAKADQETAARLRDGGR